MKKQDSSSLKNKNSPIAKFIFEKFNFWTVVILVVLVLAVIFIIYPFSRLLIQSFHNKEGGLTLENYANFFQRKYYITTLFNSLKVCVATTLLTVVLGVPMAYISTRYNIWCKKLINIMIILSLMSPPFIGAYSWILLLGRNGLITRMLGSIGINIGSIYGFNGILLVFTLKLFPFVYMYVSGALGSMDSSLEEAAENLGVSGIKKLMTVTFPLVLPTILSSALIVFMTSLADYGTPYLIGEGYRVLPVTIYDEYMGEVGGNVTFASALSVIIVLCSLTVLLFQKKVIDKRSYNMSSLRPPKIKELATGKRILATAFVFFVALLSVLPQITVVISSFVKTNGPRFVSGFSLESYTQVMFKLGKNIKNTFLFGMIALLVMMLLGLLLSYIIVRRKSKVSGFIDTLVMFPYVIPGSVLGISLVTAFNTGHLVLTGTVTILVVSYVIRKLPYTLRSSIGILYQLDTSVEEASISLGVAPMKTFFMTTARLMLPGLLSGAVLSFISTINELSSTLILYSAKTGTISVAIFSEIIRDGYGPAAALSSILTLATIVSLLIFNKISGGRSVI
ncbi:MAG TPA: iron ABC transporter permease [Candidatus Pelethocola excrementipullorum]|nr:iron ABC transporter permease [Candidatus Pelethocola excrementipullorum]